jgi:hypothetical protein
MKLLKCEVCGSSNLTKKEGFFVCDYCGCKYSLDEVRVMFSDAKMDVTGSVIKVDNDPEVEGLLKLAYDDFRRCRWESSDRRIEQAISKSPKVSDAWFLKAAIYKYNREFFEIYKSRALEPGCRSFGIFTEEMFEEYIGLKVSYMFNLSPGREYVLFIDSREDYVFVRGGEQGIIRAKAGPNHFKLIIDNGNEAVAAYGNVAAREGTCLGIRGINFSDFKRKIVD